MTMTITLIPRSREKFFDRARAIVTQGSQLWQNGRHVVVAQQRPGPDWHLIGVHIHEQAAA